MPFDIESIPQETGIYRMLNKAGKVLYIGKAKNLKARVKQYFSHQDEREMIPLLTAQIDQIDWVITITEKDALLLENTLIKKHKPKYNVLLKDDKTYISLSINIKHKWPRINLVRTRLKKDKKSLYFGPYTSAYNARVTLDVLNRIFPLRECSDRELSARKRPCLLFDIKRCLAPCALKCSHSEYSEYVTRAIQFLKGKDEGIIKLLKDEMLKASKYLEFERANEIKQTINQVKDIITSNTSRVYSDSGECDVFSVARSSSAVVVLKLIFEENRLIGTHYDTYAGVSGTLEEILSSYLLQHYTDDVSKEIALPFPLPHVEEILASRVKHKVNITAPKKGKRKELLALAHKNALSLLKSRAFSLQNHEALLLSLQETLSLTNCPIHIICFDISHHAGFDPVASKIAFEDGQYDKKQTRLYKLKADVGGDDYASMREVLERFIVKAKKENKLPDLIVLDGGKGHLKIGMSVLKEHNIAATDLISVAKEKSKHTKGMTREQVFLPHSTLPVLLPSRSPLLLFLQRLRDEAHRTCITFHKKRSSKKVYTSALDKVPGIGPIKKKRLLKHFGSVEQIKNASADELLEVPGISKKDVTLLLKMKT